MLQPVVATLDRRKNGLHIIDVQLERKLMQQLPRPRYSDLVPYKLNENCLLQS